MSVIIAARSSRSFPRSTRLPRSFGSLAVTDPLHIYQSRVARGLLKGDEAQLRAAKEFQSLYYRVKDYVPPRKAEVELRAVVRNLEAQYGSNSYGGGLQPRWWRAASRRAASNQLVRVLSNEEELADPSIPRGLLLNGEVGCGKSMLMDIFAGALPRASKGRWHYHHFMLWVYGQINAIQKRRSASNRHTSHSLSGLENEVVLFEIASTMLSRNTVLLLDEFALPDIAAAKIVKLLFTYFFRLGGVLVATSNRLPEDLYATDFRKREFRSFLTALQLRCNTLDMGSANDYRKILSQEPAAVEPHLVVARHCPQHAAAWDLLMAKVLGGRRPARDTLTVYGREIVVPWHAEGVVKFDFGYLCCRLYGPADYISLASRYHTFVIENVPVFKVSMRSEARRFITLLDALYESRCQLVVRAAAPPSELFFPDAASSRDQQAGGLLVAGQVQEEEMYSKTQLDLIAPYRPNVSNYSDGGLAFRDQGAAQKEETNFTDTRRFTGEDDMFAYKRAVSRLEEMTRSVSWRTTKQWTPVAAELRTWEREGASSETAGQRAAVQETGGQRSGVVDARQKNAPALSEAHFWSVGVWGRGRRLKDDIARRWIRGVDAKRE